jgi:hypothetical protein
MAHIIGSTPGPPNIPDKISDPVMVISPKLMKDKFRQGCHGHGRATNNSKFYSTSILGEVVLASTDLNDFLVSSHLLLCLCRRWGMVL